MNDITKPVIVDIKKLRKGLRMVATPNCTRCQGTGLQIQQEFIASCRKLDLSISICPCVKVASL